MPGSSAPAIRFCPSARRAIIWREPLARAGTLAGLAKNRKQHSRSTSRLQASRPIGEYALIGSTHSSALVHRGGDIEWLCLPRFDSAAMFASLLGDERNGHWSMRARDRKARISRRYLPGTVVLETTIRTATGVALVTDFMPRPAIDGTHEVVRIVRGLRGTVGMHTEFRIRFNYGEWCPWMERRDGVDTHAARSQVVRQILDDRIERGLANAHYVIAGHRLLAAEIGHGHNA